jgi:hypothetical protein
MSGIGSTAAAALLPVSLSDAPFEALTLLLVRVRVVRSRDISIVLFVALAPGPARSLIRPARPYCKKTEPAPCGVAFRIWSNLLPIVCRE